MTHPIRVNPCKINTGTNTTTYFLLSEIFSCSRFWLTNTNQVNMGANKNIQHITTKKQENSASFPHREFLLTAPLQQQYTTLIIIGAITMTPNNIHSGTITTHQVHLTRSSNLAHKKKAKSHTKIMPINISHRSSL